MNGIARYHARMQDRDCNPLALSRAIPIAVLVDRWIESLRGGDSFRSSATDAEAISVWISNHVKALSDWCRPHFLRDVRQVSAIVAHGADLERRIGLLARFESIFNGSASRAAADQRKFARSEHVALFSLVRQYIAQSDCLSFVLREDVSEQEFEYHCRNTMAQSLAGAAIAARGFASDRSGWEALSMCIERYIAAARLADDKDSIAALAPLSDSLMRVRSVARLHEHIHLLEERSEGLDLLHAAASKLLEMRLDEVDGALKQSPIREARP